jgi:hypothetical protein
MATVEMARFTGAVDKALNITAHNLSISKVVLIVEIAKTGLGKSRTHFYDTYLNPSARLPSLGNRVRVIRTLVSYNQLSRDETLELTADCGLEIEDIEQPAATPLQNNQSAEPQSMHLSEILQLVPPTAADPSPPFADEVVVLPGSAADTKLAEQGTDFSGTKVQDHFPERVRPRVSVSLFGAVAILLSALVVFGMWRQFAGWSDASSTPVQLSTIPSAPGASTRPVSPGQSLHVQDGISIFPVFPALGDSVAIQCADTPKANHYEFRVAPRGGLATYLGSSQTISNASTGYIVTDIGIYVAQCRACMGDIGALCEPWRTESKYAEFVVTGRNSTPPLNETN